MLPIPIQHIKALFLDIGGVLLTNGWDSEARQRACETFHLDYEEMNSRHYRVFDTYEVGKLTLDQYLSMVVFYQPQPFSREDFRSFMLAQTQPYPEMIDLFKRLKARYGLKIAVISNEGRELTEYRIHKFDLGSFVDFFVSSCFVHFRKPDSDIYCIALDVAQVPPSQGIYVEDRALFVEVARGLGIPSIHHQGYESTKGLLAEAGFPLED